MQPIARARYLAAVMVLIGVSPVRADLDLTGRWVFTLTSSFGTLTDCQDVTQSDGVLSAAACLGGPGYSGSIDVLSGALTLSQPDSNCAPTVITATAAPDGMTFSGTFSAEDRACSFGCMCCFCIDTSGTITAERLCGNGALDPDEGCDDGNLSNGDCCSSTCQVEVVGSPCPDDGDPCTTNTCDGAGGCGQLPTGCKAAGRSLFALKNHPDNDERDTLTFKWLKGAETAPGELGSPDGATEYALCVYAGSSAAVVTMPPGSNWAPIGSSGFRYKDASGSGAPSGARKALLKSGAMGKAKALVKGGGVHLPDGLVPVLPTPVTVQLVDDDTGVCFEAVYNAADVIESDAERFRARK